MNDSISYKFIIVSLICLSYFEALFSYAKAHRQTYALNAFDVSLFQGEWYIISRRSFYDLLVNDVQSQHWDKL